ncbi:MAG: VanZ family protein [Prevotella sp.]|nr:VanZ family protein [Prevotella sp.]
MKKTFVFVRKYRFSLICIALVWYLCIWFMPPEVPELENVAFLDKWTHFLMYGGTCSVIWWEYLHCHEQLNRWKLFVWAWLAPVLMSGCIELVQAYCTVNRAGEWLDFAANTTGCTLGGIIGLLMAWNLKKR